jgi:hypothetical protein
MEEMSYVKYVVELANQEYKGNIANAVNALTWGFELKA